MKTFFSMGFASRDSFWMGQTEVGGKGMLSPEKASFLLDAMEWLSTKEGSATTCQAKVAAIDPSTPEPGQPSKMNTVPLWGQVNALLLDIVSSQQPGLPTELESQALDIIQDCAKSMPPKLVPPTVPPPWMPPQANPPATQETPEVRTLPSAPDTKNNVLVGAGGAALLVGAIVAGIVGTR
jgi:hypothetical protein